MSLKLQQINIYDLPKLWHARQRGRDLLQIVVEEVEDLQIVQVGHGSWNLGDLVVREGQPGDVHHVPEPRHLLQVHEILVTEVDLGPGEALGLLKGLPDDLGRHFLLLSNPGVLSSAQGLS